LLNVLDQLYGGKMKEKLFGKVNINNKDEISKPRQLSGIVSMPLIHPLPFKWSKRVEKGEKYHFSRI